MHGVLGPLRQPGDWSRCWSRTLSRKRMWTRLASAKSTNFTSSVRVETADAQVLEKTVDSRFEKLSDAAIDSLVSEPKNKNTEQATDKWLRLFDEYCKDTAGTSL